MRTPILVAIGILVSIALPAQTRTPFQYQFPPPDAESVPRQTSIILRARTGIDPRFASEPDAISVTGSTSGRHRGGLRLASDGRTLLFVPDAPFAPGEEIAVRIESILASAVNSKAAPYEFRFGVDATPDQVVASTPATAQLTRMELTASVSESQETMMDSAAAPPDLPATFPGFTVRIDDHPAPGLLYLGNMVFGDTTRKPWAMVLDNAASPYFRERRPRAVWDFKRHANGMLSWFDTYEQRWFLFDSTMKIVRHISAKDGWFNDGHDIEILPNGNVVFITVVKRTVDMSSIVEGGDTAADVLDMGLQELDADDNVVFEWRSTDDFRITDAIGQDLKKHLIDYVHMNAIAIDADGNILISSRHLSEITKISRETGQIIWRLGGKNNQFRFVDDTVGFSYQHDINRLDNGDYLLFNNANNQTPPQSGPKEYRLDTDSMTATLVWAYQHPEGVFSAAMGSAQRLPNGNTLISWGTAPRITEVRPDSTIAFEMLLNAGSLTYRTFRLPAPSALVKGMLLTPADSAVDHPLDAMLTWERAAGATGYRLQVSTDPEFGSIAFDDTVDATFSPIPGLVDRRVYYWREMPTGESFSGVWSDVRLFMTAGNAAAQILLSPADSTLDFPMSPTLHWLRYAPESRHHLQVAADTTFSSPVLDTTMAGTYFWLNGLQSSTTYFWRVQPEMFGWIGPWSDVWSFATSPTCPEQLPTEIDLLTPSAGESFTRPGIGFSWSPSIEDSAVHLYRMQLAADAELRGIVLDTTLTSDSLRIEGRSLSPGMYWWWVRFTDTAGHQYASTVGRFEVAQWLGVRDEEHVNRSEMILHPNPATTETTVRVRVKRRSVVAIQIVDMSGRRVVEPMTMELDSGVNRIALPVSDLRNGMYSVTITSNAGTISGQFVVAR